MGITPSKIPKKLERGVPEDRKEYESWIVPTFIQLPKGRGEEAFLMYLESLGDGCRLSVNSYKFWLAGSTVDLQEIYDTYVIDSDQQTLGVTPKIRSDFLSGAKAMESLREKVKSELENKFDGFKTDLKKQYENSFKK